MSEVWTDEALAEVELLAGPEPKLEPERPLQWGLPIGGDRTDADIEHSEKLANWRLRRALIAQGKAARIKATFDAEIERLKERRAALVGPHVDAMVDAFLQVENWHRAMFAAGLAGKTIQLPNGTSSLKAAQTELVWDDMDVFTAWAETTAVDPEADSDEVLADLLFNQPAPALSLADFKKRYGLSKTVEAEPGTVLPVVTADGEPVPGVHRVARQLGHTIKLGDS